jgi:hypothetical protein
MIKFNRLRIIHSEGGLKSLNSLKNVNNGWKPKIPYSVRYIWGLYYKTFYGRNLRIFVKR